MLSLTALAHCFFAQLETHIKFVPAPVIYTGMMHNGEAHGFGKAVLKNGSSYEGEWRNGRRHGRGTQYSHVGVAGSAQRWENDQPVPLKDFEILSVELESYITKLQDWSNAEAAAAHNPASDDVPTVNLTVTRQIGLGQTCSGFAAVRCFNHR
jgi:hypothetical protein